MCFEIRSRDLLARIGKIKTKSGTVETPALLPVVNPAVQMISPRTLKEEFGCEALMTNAYILKKQCSGEAAEKEIHQLLDFKGVVMTDSGAYQILVYGKVDLRPEEIVSYQEQISTDIATILDVPTSWPATREHAEYTVKETLKRARQLKQLKTVDTILWVAPMQGGPHLDLIAFSAKQLGKLSFQIHALGSPTPIMEQYRFDTLVDMILASKMNMPLQRPLHLFGAGHPFMFALAVALGCDLFDSAAYALYARQKRYMTNDGTSRLAELDYFPCSCPICCRNTPSDLRNMLPEDQYELLAKHNLYASLGEIRRIKQRIREGRLWEHLETRAHAHPSLLQAVKRLKKYEKHIERFSPATKKSGLFFFSQLSLIRPEVVRYKKLLKTRYSPRKEAEVLLMLPQPLKKPFHKAKEIKRLKKKIRRILAEEHASFHVCVYSAPFGVVPLELSEVYPLSQHEIALPLDVETIEYVAEQVKNYIGDSAYRKVLLVEDVETWQNKVSAACRRVKRKDLSISVLRLEKLSSHTALNKIVDTLQKTLEV